MSGPVVVYTTRGLEAQMLKLLLEANGIPVETFQESVGITYGLTVGKLGEVDILVPANFEVQARSLLEAYDRGELEIQNDTDPDDDSGI